MTTSNIDSVIDGVEDSRDELQRGCRDVAEDEGDAIHNEAVGFYTADPEWLGRTQKAIRNQLRRHTNGKYSSHIYINGMMAPHAKVAEMGSGARGKEVFRGSPVDAGALAPKSDYRGDHNYDTPTMSRELLLSILAWIKTKPIIHGGDDEELAGDIASTIADKGTFQHPFIRPAWERRTNTPDGAAGRVKDSDTVRNVKRMVEDAFD